MFGCCKLKLCVKHPDFESVDHFCHPSGKVHGSGSCKVDSSRKDSPKEDDSQLQEFFLVISGLSDFNRGGVGWSGMG